MIDIFANGKPNQDVVWEDDPFATDYLMQSDNDFEMVGRDDVYDPFAGPEARRRKKTRAQRLFAHMDASDSPIEHEADRMSLGINYGPSRRVTNTYNVADRLERKRIAGEVNNALAWSETATPEQLKAQMAAVAKAQKYNVAHNEKVFMKAYPRFEGDPETALANHVGEGLTPWEDTVFFKGTPEERQAVIDDLGARIQPWQSYQLTEEDYATAENANVWDMPELMPETSEATANALRQNWKVPFGNTPSDMVSDQSDTDLDTALQAPNPDGKPEDDADQNNVAITEQDANDEDDGQEPSKKTRSAREIRLKKLLNTPTPGNMFGPDLPAGQSPQAIAAETLTEQDQTPQAKQILPIGNSRLLTLGEIAMAKSVYGDEIDFSKARIFNRVHGPWQDSGTAMAPDGKVYFHPDDYTDDFSESGMRDKAWLIHELMHVVQHQNNSLFGMKRLFDDSYTATCSAVVQSAVGHPQSGRALSWNRSVRT
ncbi:MAG: hypothetical protein HN608_01975 [Rhodospirillaceae bacterium]|nr:hypothetical protein [Rhodospirillaceae bacterium]